MNWHFWISTIGIVLYITVDVGGGHPAGTDVARLHRLGFLEYSFVETVEAMHPFYVIRALGGLLFLDRRADHGWNLWQDGELARTAAATAPAALAPAE